MKGDKRAGRPAGVPNKATSDVREAIALIAKRNVDALEGWILSIEDPAKRADLLLRMFEYHIPKLARSEQSGPDGGPITIKLVNFGHHDPA